MDKRLTEHSSNYDHLEKKTIEEITADINHENMSVPVAINKALPQINSLVKEILSRLKLGGRLFYCGCGTGGRLATLDTIEVQNTYGTDGHQIQAIFPGGINDITQTRESREDDLDNGWQQLVEKGVTDNDIVVGISASGTTPFVLSALKWCRSHGITTGCIVNNADSVISHEVDFPVEVITGPEFVTGSTRMKGGTSQKLIFDMISTTIMIQLGRVEGNKMVNVKLMSAKLMDRAARIFMERNPHINDYDYVVSLLKKYGGIKQVERYLKSLSD